MDEAIHHGSYHRATESARLLLARTVLVAALCVVCAGRAAAGLDVVLATWNLEHLAAADRAGCRPRDPDDYADLARAAQDLDADIVALQEVESARAVARVFDPADYAIVVSSRPSDPPAECRGMPGQARTALRTGFAIHRERIGRLGLRWRELPALDDIGREGHRWGTRIAVLPQTREVGALPSGLQLLSVHLKSGCQWGRLGPDDRALRLKRLQCLTLRRQRGILESWIDAQAAADRPFVVIGDMNRQLDQRGDDFWRAIDDGEVCDWRDDPDLGRRCIVGSERTDADANLALAGAGRPFPYPHNARYPYAIDHAIFGGGAARWLVPESYRVLAYEQDPPPSDHHPIRMTIRLPAAWD